MRAWLVLAAGRDRQHGGNDGYDDEPSSHYSWDSTVSNYGNIARGDLIVLWNKRSLLGASAIERIDESDEEKTRYRCPSCGDTGFKTRASLRPVYRCHKCRAEFDSPSSETIEIRSYRTEHSTGWVKLKDKIGAADLRTLCKFPKSIQSLRLLHWEAFKARLGPLDSVVIAERTSEELQSSTRRTIVRAHALPTSVPSTPGTISNECSFSGASASVESAALTEFPPTGGSRCCGHLTLRTDILRALDLGALCVNPQTHKIDLTVDARGVSSLAKLHGKEVHRETALAHAFWLRRHWELFRGG